MLVAYIKTTHRNPQMGTLHGDDVEVIIADKSERWNVMKFGDVPCSWREADVTFFQPERLSEKTLMGCDSLNS